MKISPKWMSDPALQQICDLFQSAGFKIYFVGGCVRDAVLGVDAADVDMSTNAQPKEIFQLVENTGLKAIPTGIDHGTVTLVLGDTSVEVTTFRKDVETDGRRAVVAFSDDIGDDALRRDFTMNALYADQTGRILDPLDGLADLRKNRVRFIESPEKRIREDYLRILRFFRFHAWYGTFDIDADGLSACAQLADGLETLSVERVTSEMIKLLCAPDPAPAIASMSQSGVIVRILEGADRSALAPLVHFEGLFGASPDAIRRLAVLSMNASPLKLRLNNKDAKRLKLYCEAARDLKPVAHLSYWHGVDAARDIWLIHHALMGQIPENIDNALSDGANAVFPIKSIDLPNYSGKSLGQKLAELETLWIASDFGLTKEELLEK